MTHPYTTWRRLCVLTLVFWFAHSTAGRADLKRPNIVLIMADDMGYECVSSNGGTSYATPNIDRLATGGMRFLNAHSQPICTPSRVQIMTGIYNERNYVRFGLLDPAATTFANLLKQAGYATCIVGKWQLEGGMDGPTQFGFDEFCLWQLTRRPGRYPNPGLEINGREVDFSNGEYGPDVACDFLCDFISRHREGPFFAYYPMILPHWPFEPTPDSSDWDAASKGVLKGVGDAKYFGDMVSYTDKLVGKVVRTVDQLGLSQDTLIVFTADNGTYRGITSRMGDVPVQGGKGTTLDTGTHVPFVARWPGSVPAGEVSESLVDFSDLLPTLTEIAGTSAPDDIDGISFLPVLRDAGAITREWIYCWYERNGRRQQASQHVRDQRFKLYADGRFFDLEVDPLEKHPIRESSGQLASRRRLAQAFELVLSSGNRGRRTDGEP